MAESIALVCLAVGGAVSGGAWIGSVGAKFGQEIANIAIGAEAKTKGFIVGGSVSALCGATEGAFAGYDLGRDAFDIE